jgi:hypothetical protein
MEVMLLANNYFMVVFNYIADCNRVFEGRPYSTTKLDYLLNHGMLVLIPQRSSRIRFWCVFTCLTDLRTKCRIQVVN